MSIAQKSDVTTDDNTLPIFGPDENLMKGTAFQAKFTDATYSWNPGATAYYQGQPVSQVVANGAAIGNAAPGKAAGQLAGLPASPKMSFVAGKGFLLGAPATTDYERIVLEQQGGVLDTNLTNNKIVWAWLTLPTVAPATDYGSNTPGPSTGYKTAIVQGYLITKTGSYSNTVPGVVLDLTNWANRTFQAKFGNNASGVDINWIPATIPQGPRLWGLARMTYSGDPVIADGTYVELYLDRICVARALTTSALTAVANDLSIGRPSIGSSSPTSVPGTYVHGGGVEDLTISGRSAQQAMDAEYEMYAGTWG